jgi:hypothetical protein
MGLPDVPDEWRAQREAHYVRHFGPPVYIYHEVLAQQPHLDVCVCGPSEELGRSFYTYVTSGMSDLPMRTPEKMPADRARELRRAELLVYVSEADQAAWQDAGFPERWLLWLASAVHEWQTFFAPTHTVPNGDPPQPLLPGSSMTTAFLLPATHGPEAVRHGLKLGDDPVSFLRVVPITNAECDYKVQRGPEALMALLEARSPRRELDMFREPFV